ncbi:sensor histidine kinase [Fulvivirga ligni]|uniref:sensor histidine kinase n=1 Tax=Fulvivirga ligni TaxID=2904246 RepID=UPI001F3C6D17|nr:histidine kinase [Fulvivirga ligni]UII23049.1 histidine kinase [Fulvivirga ligni]
MTLSRLLQKTYVRHVLFWICIYVFYVSTAWVLVEDRSTLMILDFYKLLSQMFSAYGILYLLVPKLLHKNKILFTLSVLAYLYLSFALMITLRYYYLEIEYASSFRVPDASYWWRVTDFKVFFNEIIWHIFPTLLLASWSYYTRQRELVELREQQKITELNLLKNQLNPHFLFNTLNNLYTLALKKSDDTPDVIARLSDIFDYMLYRCNDQFVPLSGEISLLENYLALEKVRYGKRLQVHFTHKVESTAEIAPLLMLTFIENAFKHGVKEEIKVASIDIDLKASSEIIAFTARNSKPQIVSDGPQLNREAIGLANAKKRLNLLYPEKHHLHIEETQEFFKVTLKLELS